MQTGKIIPATVLLTALFITGCADHDETELTAPVKTINPFFFGLTNIRILYSSNTVFRTFGDKTHFIEAHIGLPESPYTGEPPFFIRLPDGSVLNLAANDIVSLIHGYFPFRNSGSTEYTWTYHDMVEHRDHPWPDHTEQFQITPYTFYINNGKLLGMNVHIPNGYSAEQYAPAIGMSPSALYELPLSTEEYLELLGQPERIVDTFSE